ncbi:MAG: TetR/AcrR family transcriptional regulator [Oscillospiraceae bacterium]|nr:TetR/AcrR family transcriptional regulator [Oscillospiraceae bacterium]
MPNFTKTAIKNTFVKLLNEKPLNQITVKNIVEECGINRNSFYYHFQDIPSLIEELVIDEMNRIISQYPTVDSFEQALTAATEFASENRRAILHIYNSVNRDIFEQYLWKVCDYVVSSYAASVFDGKPISDFDKELLVRLFKCSCFGLCIDWMDNKMKDDVSAQIARFCELHRDMFEEMVNRSVESDR